MRIIANEQNYLDCLGGAIDYFWCSDSAFVWTDETSGYYLDEPLLIHHGNINKVWNWFISYAEQNIMETLCCDGKTADLSVIRKVINDNFELWLNYQRKLYPERVLV